MIRLIGKIPNSCYVSCSGGPDSMAALDFVIRGRRKPTVIHFDHGTDHASDARELVEKYCYDKQVKLIVHEITGSPSKGESQEAWWRDRRYEVLNALGGIVVTGHNLNDVAEWWIFTSLRGNPCIMPYQTKNVIKPFIPTHKEILENWCIRKNIPFVCDPTNFGKRFARSRIRHNIIPEALEVNPGFLTVMSKKIYSAHGEKE
tara:strand:+ start:23739 stop:24347 length:609 start_codon:yes stop_codon:yes gene_type:complete